MLSLASTWASSFFFLFLNQCAAGNVIQPNKKHKPDLLIKMLSTSLNLRNICKIKQSSRLHTYMYSFYSLLFLNSLNWYQQNLYGNPIYVTEIGMVLKYWVVGCFQECWPPCFILTTVTEFSINLICGIFLPNDFNDLNWNNSVCH